jgi:hypothetical protein
MVVSNMASEYFQGPPAAMRGTAPISDIVPGRRHIFSRADAGRAAR